MKTDYWRTILATALYLAIMVALFGIATGRALGQEFTETLNPATGIVFVETPEGSYDVFLAGKVVARCPTIKDCPYDAAEAAKDVGTYIITIITEDGQRVRSVARTDGLCPAGSCNSDIEIETRHPQFPDVKNLRGRTDIYSTGRLGVELVPIYDQGEPLSSTNSIEVFDP